VRQELPSRYIFIQRADALSSTGGRTLVLVCAFRNPTVPDTTPRDRTKVNPTIDTVGAEQTMCDNYWGVIGPLRPYHPL
jgi:hypothetical protein